MLSPTALEAKVCPKKPVQPTLLGAVLHLQEKQVNSTLYTQQVIAWMSTVDLGDGHGT